MLIKTRLRFVALLPAVFALLIGSVLWVSWNKIDRARGDAELAEKVLLSNFELNILTQEYLLYGGKRIESQLWVSHQSMGQFLAQLKYDDIEEQELVDALRHGHQELGSLHTLLLEGKIRAREQIVGALLVSAQTMRARARQFADIQYRQVVELQRLADKSVMVALALLAVVSAALLLLMARRLTRGIGQLDEGVRRVAAGDLEHRIQLATADKLPLSTADELSSLAHSFDNMSLKLRDSYTSIDNLNKEVVERKQAEQEIIQLNIELEHRVAERTAKLAASNKELEAFSYSVSHDLRAPLRAIAGFVELLKKHNYDAIDDKGRHYMEVISVSAIQMGKLIDDILTFSRIGRVEMTPGRVNLDQVLEEVRETLRPQSAGRKIEWRIGSLPEVDGERSMLSLVLLNLLSNALKFTQPRESPIIEIGQIKDNAHEVTCYVRDNGVGFDMQHVNKLFGLFQRLHVQEQFEGTGVGLANVQRIVERHGGRVWAEGKVDEGATFYFALPVKRDNPKPGEPEPKI